MKKPRPVRPHTPGTKIPDRKEPYVGLGWLKRFREQASAEAVRHFKARMKEQA